MAAAAELVAAVQVGAASSGEAGATAVSIDAASASRISLEGYVANLTGPWPAASSRLTPTVLGSVRWATVVRDPATSAGCSDGVPECAGPPAIRASSEAATAGALDVALSARLPPPGN